MSTWTSPPLWCNGPLALPQINLGSFSDQTQCLHRDFLCSKLSRGSGDKPSSQTSVICSAGISSLRRVPTSFVALFLNLGSLSDSTDPTDEADAASPKEELKDSCSHSDSSESISKIR